jgi:alpha-D-xyloside xylohydrolase
MAAELRAGLSFGLSGFTYWSHDVGGFVNRAPRDLYRRWLAFGALTSHTRTHGAPPREPWEYDSAFVVDFRRAMELKYSLLPYIYAQSVESSRRGWPVLRTLFFEYPDDPTSWLVEDEYMFGSDLLVAPLLADTASARDVYLPPGSWIDFQSGRRHAGGRWERIVAGEIPIVLLAREGSAIPLAAVAQHTGAVNWKQLELRVFGGEGGAASGTVALPNEPAAAIRVEGGRVTTDPLRGRVSWRVTRPPAR